MFDFNNANELIDMLWGLKWEKYKYPSQAKMEDGSHEQFYRFMGVRVADAGASEFNAFITGGPEGGGWAMVVAFSEPRGYKSNWEVKVTVFTTESAIVKIFNKPWLVPAMEHKIEDDAVTHKLSSLYRNLCTQHESRKLSGLMSLIKPLAKPDPIK